MDSTYREQEFEKSCGKCKFRKWLFQTSKYTLNCARCPKPKEVKKNGLCDHFEHNVCGSCRHIERDGGYCFCDKTTGGCIITPEQIACNKWRKK